MKSDQGFVSLIRHLVAAEGGGENDQVQDGVAGLLSEALDSDELILLTRDELKDVMTEAFKDGQRWKREHSLEGALMRTHAGISRTGIAMGELVASAGGLPPVSPASPSPMTGPGRSSPAFSPAYKRAVREALIRSKRRGGRRHA